MSAGLSASHFTANTPTRDTDSRAEDRPQCRIAVNKKHLLMFWEVLFFVSGKREFRIAFFEFCIGHSFLSFGLHFGWQSVF